ncbi:ABC transporter transmembrane region [Rhizoctonia solani]|uniref:ABC transporter transmembrane region n=1 Tax=Rhizoctonia solani TaxID=456999 RepID=A0A8H7IFU5_9AGAM|nr:ABC transporter transmembrane region [Rhizoctonia solani]
MELTKQDSTRNGNSRRPQHHGPAFFYAFTYADRLDWLLYGVGGVAAVISGAGFPVLDLVYGYWTTALVAADMTPSSLRGTTNTMAGICLGIGILQFITGSIFLTCFTIASGRTTDRLRRAYLDSVLHQDAEFFERVGPGEVGTRMIKDVGTIKTATGEKLGFMVWAFTTLLVALIMAFSRAARLAGVVFGVVPLAFILFMSSGYLAAKADARLLDVEGQAGTLLEQILSSVRVVQSFAAESFLVKKYDAYLDQLQRLGKWCSVVRGLELSISYCILNLTYSVAFWYGSQLIVRDNLEVGLMFTVFWNMFNAIFAIANILPHISAIRNKGEKLWDSQTGEKINASIEVRNLTFSYPSRPDHKTLDDVSFVLEAGKVTALVGASGSGKSTIASLLLRYYDPLPAQGGKSSGGIFLAKRDIRDLNLPWLRSQIGIIAQDPQLFTASIFENVAYGLSGTPWELPTSESEPNYQERLADAKIRVEYALKQAQAWDFVCKLPEGMDTRIKGGRTGVLSGGQRQRIAAARALVRKPRILLLDEGTSALDAETEQRMMAAVHEEQAQSGMTTILIAHRLSSIQNADRIIAMSNGRLPSKAHTASLCALVRHQASAGQLTSNSQTTVSNFTNKEPETGNRSATFSTPHVPLYRPVSTVSVARTVIDDPMERGLLVKGIEPQGLAARFFRLMGRYSQWILIGIIGSLCIGASFPIAGWLIGFVIEGLSIHDNDEQVLKEGRYWAMWFLVLSMVNIVSSFIAGFFLSMGGTRVDRRLRLVALSSLLRQEIGFFDQEENAAGSLTAGIASQAGHVSAAIGLVWQQLITSGGNFIGAFILGVVLSWKLALPSFAPVPAILVTAYFNIALLEKYEQTLHKPLEDASAFASENVDAIKVSFWQIGIGGRLNKIITDRCCFGKRKLGDGIFRQNFRSETTKTKYLFGGALGFGFGIGSILILSAILMVHLLLEFRNDIADVTFAVQWWGVELYLTERISLKNLYATFEAVLIGAIAASRLFTYIPDMARMIQGFRAICNWEDRKPEIASLDAIKAPSLEKVRGRLLSHHVHCIIPAGKSVAFCGPSGGGKSSIISMISRFYDPNLGTISLDGRDIRSIPLEEYRSHISLVAQDAVLYEGTFRENITLGQTSISQDEIERACRDANILSFIQSLPQGFDSPVGFKGSQMSGGQRQRICIARALLRNPSILLLDEATSALDAESERSVQEALEQASKGRTTISIAHRLSTIQNADIIHVVEDGRIVESGSHVELLALNGRYVDLVKSQL